VDLSLDLRLGEGYHSKSQVARVVTQAWIGREIGCLTCTSPRLAPTTQNTKARDFVCDRCSEPYELKSTAGHFGRWVNDGQYETFLDTISSARAPNLFLLECDMQRAVVGSLTAVHRQSLSPLAIVPRNPLGPAARRKGWKGCNIDLTRVPASGRVSIVSGSRPVRWDTIRELWSRLGFMISLQPQEQGWIRDTLACLERLPEGPFDVRDVYASERELAALHPENRHVRPKIRQQLQRLVAKGIIVRTERGKYAKVS
jgi:type II restriction enzyme